jgi:hypothetical protein
MHGLLAHASRQSRSWLIFDVRQNRFVSMSIEGPKKKSWWQWLKTILIVWLILVGAVLVFLFLS